MGLACSQIRLLTLTARKADCELAISIDSLEKQALTREQSQLTAEYYSRLQAKKVCYYANGQYSKMDYHYLMGSKNYMEILNNSPTLKTDNNMILTDYKGQVVLSDSHANAILSVLGRNAMDSNGRGGTFSQDKIAEIIAAFIPGYKVQDIQNVIDEKAIDGRSYSATSYNTLNGTSTGQHVTVDNTEKVTSDIEKVVNFYMPIFKAAAANGWTTEYNKEMDPKVNPDYVSDALVTGSFQLEHVNDAGNYDEGTSLTYFVTSGDVQTRTDSQSREEITAWYNSQKEIIACKENILDTDISDLSTELEAINTEMQSIQSYIDNAIQSVFDWGSS